MSQCVDKEKIREEFQWVERILNLDSTYALESYRIIIDIPNNDIYAKKVPLWFILQKVT